MYTVYLLHSEKFPDKRYIGFTKDLPKRLKSHNAGQSTHTARHKPWIIVLSIDFYDKKQALAFEAYLKSGSGRAFANKHFW